MRLANIHIRVVFVKREATRLYVEIQSVWESHLFVHLLAVTLVGYLEMALIQ